MGQSRLSTRCLVLSLIVLGSSVLLDLIPGLDTWLRPWSPVAGLVLPLVYAGVIDPRGRAWVRRVPRLRRWLVWAIIVLSQVGYLVAYYHDDRGVGLLIHLFYTTLWVGMLMVLWVIVHDAPSLTRRRR